MFLTAGLAPAILSAAEPDAQARLTRTFDLAAPNALADGSTTFPVPFPAILESESMVAIGISAPNGVPDSSGKIWDKVLFSNPDGSAATERILNPKWDANPGSLAYKSRVFLKTSTSYRVVDRNPLVPEANLGLADGWELGAITDEFLIFFHTFETENLMQIQFRDPQTFEVIGTVPCKVRPIRMAASATEIFFVSEDAKGTTHLHRMPYPDFSKGPSAKVKIAGIAGKYSAINHFSANYAVAVDLKGYEVIVRWSDPAFGGKAGLYPSKVIGSNRWLESGDRLGTITTYPELSVSHVKFGKKVFTFEPAGMPEGFRSSGIHSIASGSVYLTPPMHNLIFGNATGWTYRLDTNPGRELSVDSPVADERDVQMRFRVSLDSAATTAVTFDYETAGRSAVSGVDFTATSGTVTLAAGQTEAFVDVPLLEDQTIERPETLELRITGLSGAFCDEQVTPGRIRGSGKRVLEEVEVDDGSVLDTLDDSLDRTAGVRVLELTGGDVVARDYGFEFFVPIANNSGSYFYARGLIAGTDKLVLCQFDPATAELLEVFNTEAARKVDGDEFIIQKGEGYVRYGFYDGLPVLNLEGLQAVEGGGAHSLVVRSERTHAALDLDAEWVVPTTGLGTIAFNQLLSGDIAFDITPQDDETGKFDLKPVIAATVGASGSPESTTMLSSFTLVEDDAATTTHVATTTFSAGALAADGNRLWLGQRRTALLESLKFEGGTLSPAAKVTIPGGAKLLWQGFYGEGLSGQGIAFDGTNLFSGGWVNVNNQGLVSVAGAGAAKPKAKYLKGTAAAGGGNAHLLLPGLRVIGAANPSPGFNGSVLILDSRNNKLLRTLIAPVNEPSFGYALAVSGNTLWISAPRQGGGRVYGYSTSTFQHETTLSSPDPVRSGTFGYSIAGSATQLVVGEPSTRAPGSVWVYSADGATMQKKLVSGVSSGSDGFGGRVATSGGRVLVSAATVSFELYQLADSPQDWPGSEAVENTPDGVHLPVLLWENINAEPLRLKPATAGSATHASGWAIALLDGCAVFASRSATTGGLEVYSFAP